MATVVYKARVRKDGLLALPRTAREKLGVHQGDEVEVQVKTQASSEENPLLALIGIGKGGKPDGAENHDKYLYESDPL